MGALWENDAVRRPNLNLRSVVHCKGTAMLLANRYFFMYQKPSYHSHIILGGLTRECCMIGALPKYNEIILSQK